MPDILTVTIDGDILELLETVGLTVSSNFSIPQTNFVPLSISSYSSLNLPDELSNFAYLDIHSSISDEYRLSELINVRIIIVPSLLLLSQRDNVAYISNLVNVDITGLDTQTALLVNYSSIAQLFEYSDLVTRLLFAIRAGCVLTTSSTYNLIAAFGTHCNDSCTHGMILSDTAPFTASSDISSRLAQVLKVLISGSSSINFTVLWDEYAQFIAICNSLFKSADLQQVGISVEALLTLEKIISTIVREYIVTSFSELSTLNAHELPNYVVNSIFDIISNVNLINSIELLVDTSLVITVPRWSSITATWYFMPKALSMHTMSPESVCEVDDILYMAFDDGIYVFDSSKEASNTGLVYDFGDLSIPAFKRLEELFISGEILDELNIAVDMDDWRNEYSSEISRIKFAKGHKGYRIKMFIEGLKRLDSLDLLLVFLTKRRR